jgi:hypothetical protein
MQRDHYNAVTQPGEATTLPVLLPAGKAKPDGAASWEEHFGLFHPVRRLRGSELKSMVAGLPSRERKRFTGLVTLRQALESQDALLAGKLVQSYKTLVRDIMARYFPNLKLPVAPNDLETVARFLMMESRRDTAAAILSQLLTPELSKAKLVVWRTESGTLPAIYCDDVRTALFVCALIGPAATISLCPRCGSVFIRKRPDQVYCSIQCREAHRVARWRKGREQKFRREGKQK